MTKIEWTDATWNPIVGCSVVSPGCKNCYAMRMAGTRLKDVPRYKGLTQSSKTGPVWTGEVRIVESVLTQPIRWQKPRMIFVNSMSDLFHKDVPDEWIDRIFAVMALCPQHTFQVLTKRPERMREYLGPYAPDRIYLSMKKFMRDFPDQTCDWMGSSQGAMRQFDEILLTPRDQPLKVISTREIIGWPLSNVWLGTSVEDQARADERIPHLLATPAAVRFLSVEPLLGPVDFTCRPLPDAAIEDEIDRTHRWNALSGVCRLYTERIEGRLTPSEQEVPLTGRLDWVIVGGESGPGARPMDLDWMRSIRDQCEGAGVPCFIKQLGARPYETKPADGRPRGVSHALANLGSEHPQRKWFSDWTLVHSGDDSAWYRYYEFRDKKGGDPAEWPEDLRVREYPDAE